MNDLIELARRSLDRRRQARPMSSRPLPGEVLMVGEYDGWVLIRHPDGNVVWVREWHAR